MGFQEAQSFTPLAFLASFSIGHETCRDQSINFINSKPGMKNTAWAWAKMNLYPQPWKGARPCLVCLTQPLPIFEVRSSRSRILPSSDSVWQEHRRGSQEKDGENNECFLHGTFPKMMKVSVDTTEGKRKVLSSWTSWTGGISHCLWIRWLPYIHLCMVKAGLAEVEDTCLRVGSSFATKAHKEMNRGQPDQQPSLYQTVQTNRWVNSIH